MSGRRSGDEFRATRSILVGLGASLVGAVVFMVTFSLSANTQLMGAALAVALGGIGYGLTAWAHRLMPPAGEVEEREHMSEVAGPVRFREELYGRASGVGRRRLLGGAFAVALGALGIGVLFPLRSLGPRPRDELRHTDYSKVHHPRLVTLTGTPVHRDDLPVGGFLTVFPEGYVGSADGQTALMRIDPDLPVRPPTEEEWVVDGYLAYSKVCTHAGCPVGEYQVEFHSLFCPCHQSAFMILEGGQPRLGPADRPLPQLPIAFDDEGFLIATGDFNAAVGPGWWTRP